MPLSRVLPTNMFIMWCKKCWRYLECSEIKMKAGGNQKSKKSEVVHDTVEEFAEFFIFPHEFLCLTCNSFDRFDLIEDMYKPNFKLRKTEIFNIATHKQGKPTLESKRQYYYQVTGQDLRGECRPKHLL